MTPIHTPNVRPLCVATFTNLTFGTMVECQIFPPHRRPQYIVVIYSICQRSMFGIHILGWCAVCGVPTLCSALVREALHRHCIQSQLMYNVNTFSISASNACTQNDFNFNGILCVRCSLLFPGNAFCEPSTSERRTKKKIDKIAFHIKMMNSNFVHHQNAPSLSLFHPPLQLSPRINKKN